MRSLKLFSRKPKGVSLPIAIGLVLLLISASVAVNQVIIRTLRSVSQIESGTRAYLAAEAGMEDALYDLSSHFAGYEQAGTFDFTPGGSQRWQNKWRIDSLGLSACPADELLCGAVDRKRKLTLSLFQDTASGIQTLSVSNFLINFGVPAALVSANASAFADGLRFDNDNDWGGDIAQVNEDGVPDNGVCPVGPGNTPVAGQDADCDGLENEDSPEDPVIYWKFSDGAGHTLVPKKGCLTASVDPGSEICEMDFSVTDVQASLSGTDIGVREDGITEQTIDNFLIEAAATLGQKLQGEFMVVAPLEQVYADEMRKIPIAALDYVIPDTVSTGGDTIPDPFFVIESDGYFRDFKQSISTTVTPKTSVPLFDFTIIQQQ